jgi:glycerol-3-phosphate O-acyltransferase / dihydroxyacetone phosphate acyltransferase
LVALPMYLLGVVHNFLPYKLPAWISLRITQDTTFLAAFNFGLGIVLFVLFYALYGYIFLQLIPSYFLLLLYYVLIGTTGFVSYYYWHFAKKLVERAKLSNILQKDTEIIPLRKQLLAELEKSRDEYIASLQ